MRSLLVLLGDEEPEVVDAARRAPVDLGVDVASILREHLRRTDLTLRFRIRDVLSRITAPPRRRASAGRPGKARADDLDLEEALFAVARPGTNTSVRFTTVTC